MPPTPAAEVVKGSRKTLSKNKIKQHPRNVRQGDVSKIRQSIRANGFITPLIIQESTGFIIKGNHSYQAGLEEGITKFPCVVVDVNDDTAYRFMLADNKASDHGRYDESSLASLLKELHEESGTLDGTGFSFKEMNSLLDRLEKVEIDTSDIDADDEPAPPALLTDGKEVSAKKDPSEAVEQADLSEPGAAPPAPPKPLERVTLGDNPAVTIQELRLILPKGKAALVQTLLNKIVEYGAAEDQPSAFWMLVQDWATFIEEQADDPEFNKAIAADIKAIQAESATV